MTQEKESLLNRFYRKGAKVVVYVIYRCRFSGFKENIPKEGAAVIIANHISYMDGMVLHAASPRPVRFVIDAAIYNVPSVKYWMERAGAIPIRPNRKAVKQALEQVSEALKQGDIVCIFPEGSLTYTGKMARFRMGIELIIKNDPVPVIPVAIKGLWGSIFSRKYRKAKVKWMPRKLRMKVSAICGKPIPPDRVKVGYLQREIMRLWNDA